VTDPWDDPIEGAEWSEKTPPKLTRGEYIRDARGERLKVLAAFPIGATVPVWYVTAYRPGEATRQSSVDVNEPIPVEVR
jgi:hypothetical protein